MRALCLATLMSRGAAPTKDEELLLLPVIEAWQVTAARGMLLCCWHGVESRRSIVSFMALRLTSILTEWGCVGVTVDLAARVQDVLIVIAIGHQTGHVSHALVTCTRAITSTDILLL